MNILLLLFVGTVAWGRAPVNKCFWVFRTPEMVRFSKPEIEKLFYAEYQRFDTKPILLSDHNVQNLFRNFLVLDDFAETSENSHEINSSQLYTETVLSRSDEQLLFLSSYKNFSVPGFDGIIYGRNGYPVANYSLKESQGNWERALSEAFSKAYLYSSGEHRWFNSITGKNYDKETEFIYEKDSWEQFHQTTFPNIVYLVKLFGGKVRCQHCIPRKTRVVIHLRNGSVHLGRREIKYIQQRILDYENYIQSVTFVDGTDALIIFPNSTNLITGRR